MSNAVQTAVAAYLSGRNRAINGACSVAQRAALTLATSAGSTVSGYGGPDRYRASNSAGGSFTQSQGAFSYAGRNLFAVTQTVNTLMTDSGTSNYWGGISQYFEGFNVADLRGQPVTVQFVFCASLAGSYTLSIRDGTNANSCLFHFVAAANTPTRYVFTTPPVPLAAIMPWSNLAGLSIMIGAINTGNFLTPASNEGQWIAGNYIAIANGQMNWGFVSTSAFIQVSQLQVEAGPIATPFEMVDYAIDLTRCMRYCQNMFGTFVGGYQVASAAIYADFNFPVVMRVQPTQTFGTVTYTNATAFTTAAINQSYIRLAVNVTTTGYGYGYLGGGLLLNSDF
jgi:hypothetical protein